jgi:site-specific recombinase XerD
MTKTNQTIQCQRPALPGFEQPLADFLRSLTAKNRSAATLLAYETDLRQFVAYLAATNVAATEPGCVERIDVVEFLADLGARGASGVSRARKLSAIREFFRSLVTNETIARSPADGVETPRRERNIRTYLRPEEYSRMLSLAGSNPRDYAMLETFLQTGVRVSELCTLTIDDLDLEGRVLRVRGKGMVAREVDLERKGVLALKNWLNVRPPAIARQLFLNKDGGPFGVRGVRKLVEKYRGLAGITRKASCHSLRHTFATYKAERGVSAFQLQRWLGHASVATTQIYVHLGRQSGRKLMEETSL